MTMNKHNVLKNNNKFKEHQFYKILYMWSKLLNKELNLIELNFDFL